MDHPREELKMLRRLAELEAKAAGKPAPVAAEPEQSGGIGQTIGNLAAGAVRGAGSIGATLMTPIDAAARSVGVQNDFIGRTDRREAMDAGLQSMGAQPDSLAYGGGKLAAEIAGSAGAGGVVAKALSAVPGLAAAAPGVLKAVETAGMSAGAGGMGARIAGGALAGGAAAGLVNPDDAAVGAAVGGALPGALKVAGMAGNKVGSVIRGPTQAPQLAQAVSDARSVGYVIPPTQARPTLVNRVLEGLSGKITTAQNASARNQGVTNRLAADALGLPKDAVITPDVLKAVRDTAGQAYEAIGASGVIQPTGNYTAALDRISAPFRMAAVGFPGAKPSPVLELVESLKSPQFDAASAVSKVRELRSAADDAFRTGNTDVGRASKAAAGAIEDAIEAHLSSTGQKPLLQAFRDARTLIAKTYSVEKALNPASGSVDARKLAAQVAKGKPLSGELRQAADFAGQFPKAAQAVEGMGSLPQTSPLDWGMAGGLSMATANPLLMATAAARPVARAATLSPAVQNRLVQSPQQASAIARLFGSPEAQQLLYRGAPVITADR